MIMFVSKPGESENMMDGWMDGWYLRTQRRERYDAMMTIPCE